MPKDMITKTTEGNFLSIIQNDIPFIEEKYIESIVASFQTFFQLIIYGALLCYLDYRILIVVIILTICSLLLPNITAKKISSKKSHHSTILGSYIDKVKDHLTGNDHINRLTKDNIENNINDSLIKSENTKFIFGKYKTFTNILQGAFALSIQLIVFGLAIYLSYKGEITKGIAIASISYANEFLFPLRYLVNCLNDIKSTKEIRLKLLKFNNYSNPNKTILSTIDNIVFDNVYVKLDSFSLNNLNFTIEKGKKYLVLGANGVGKSTLLNILRGKVNVFSGSILIDKKNLNVLDIDNCISFVNQYSHIYQNSYMDNVTIFDTYSNKNIPNLSIKLQEKINYLMNIDDCSILSGGEKQLVTTLRCLNENKEIAFLDEFTSAMDNTLKKEMMNIILQQYKTVICISHDKDNEFINQFDCVLYINNNTITIKER